MLMKGPARPKCQLIYGIYYYYCQARRVCCSRSLRHAQTGAPAFGPAASKTGPTNVRCQVLISGPASSLSTTMDQWTILAV